MDLPHDKWLERVNAAERGLTEEQALDVYADALSDLVAGRAAFRNVSTILVGHAAFFEILALPVGPETSRTVARMLEIAREIRTAYGQICSDLLEIAPTAFDWYIGVEDTADKIISLNDVEQLNEQKNPVPKVRSLMSAALDRLSDEALPATVDEVVTSLLYAARALYRMRSSMS